MKFLLDTHVVLWVAENSSRLSNEVKDVVLNRASEKFVSIASAWEIAVKLGTKKLDLVGGLPEFFRMIDDNGFQTLAVEREYLQEIPTLPDHHKDPFDRLLIATALAENLTIITADESIHKYDVPWIW